ncbi:hypothetical protein RAC90_10265 [Pantoea sp. CS_6]|uniref:DUF6678 family protein n=1 Tax=Pantoea sp. CS_6 TaxID=3055795 RepID=UPI0035C105ED
MNNTKWNEIRVAMGRMESPPSWKITLLNGYESAVDGEWFYHFCEGGYLDIQYLDILTNSVAQHAIVGPILRAIHQLAPFFGLFIYLESSLKTVIEFWGTQMRAVMWTIFS